MFLPFATFREAAAFNLEAAMFVSQGTIQDAAGAKHVTSAWPGLYPRTTLVRPSPKM